MAQRNPGTVHSFFARMLTQAFTGARPPLRSTQSRETHKQMTDICIAFLFIKRQLVIGPGASYAPDER